MPDLKQYSYNKVGDVWSEADHKFLVAQLDKINKLAQDVYNAGAHVLQAGAKVQGKR